jgi:hypothetical protein
MTRTCSAEGCDRKHRARGWCDVHYARVKKSGRTELLPTYSVCTVDGCSSNPRTQRTPLCEKHYYRLRRTGSTADPAPRQKVEKPKREPRPPQPVRICAVEGCDRSCYHKKDHCRMHYLRLLRRGDVNFTYNLDRVRYWTGSDCTYQAAHQRVRKALGRASDQSCVDCGARARHWSYNHGDPNGLFEEGLGPYSSDPKWYEARCVRCHKKFDLARLRTESKVGKS